jgi:DNA-directed RNA polymerase specialized sigma24 family protein
MLFVTENADDSDETAKALRGCLKALREEDRVLLRNRYSGKNTLRAYAEETGRSEAGIRVSLYRLKKSLKACVEAKVNRE